MTKEIKKTHVVGRAVLAVLLPANVTADADKSHVIFLDRVIQPWWNLHA
jgi:hypothetical protein